MFIVYYWELSGGDNETKFYNNSYLILATIY